jgi:hypothetical protein
MRFSKSLIVGALLFRLTGVVAEAAVKVVIERNDEVGASDGWEFKVVPSPVKNDAASQATFTLVDGRRDANAGDLSVLNDGKVPTNQDQPRGNFFFDQGQDGGRLALDLGKAIDVKQVNVYSWHPNTRGPQVYRLYAADGSARDFAAQPRKGTDPVKGGWEPIAAVDTRPKDREGGGQYGVSIASTSGLTIGKYRYLLFDVSATEMDDPFGNTFFSEIDVIDAAGAEVLEAAALPVARAISRSPESAPYHITIDYTDAPELKDWVETKLQPIVDQWYPRIVAALPSEGYTAPSRVTIAITKKYRGVAATAGTHVVCAADWFQKNHRGEAAGAVIHELVNVVQQYPAVRGGTRHPGWLQEGVADYLRWFKFEPTPTGTRPRNPDKARYTDSYRTTAGFLNYVVEKHDKEIVAKLNAAMRRGRYNVDLWKEYTGSTVDELWAEYAATLKESYGRCDSAIFVPSTSI